MSSDADEETTTFPCPQCGYGIDPTQTLQCPRCGKEVDCSTITCSDCDACSSFVRGLTSWMSK